MFNPGKMQILFIDLWNRFLHPQKILSLLKIKALKFILKLTLFFGVLWFFSGSWLGGKLAQFGHIIWGGTYPIVAGMLGFIQIIAQILLVFVLILTVFGKPIWRGLYILIGLGLIVAILQRFVF